MSKAQEEEIAALKTRPNPTESERLDRELKAWKKKIVPELEKRRFPGDIRLVARLEEEAAANRATIEQMHCDRHEFEKTIAKLQSTIKLRNEIADARINRRDKIVHEKFSQIEILEKALEAIRERHADRDADDSLVLDDIAEIVWDILGGDDTFHRGQHISDL